MRDTMGVTCVCVVCGLCKGGDVGGGISNINVNNNVTRNLQRDVKRRGGLL